MKGHIKEEQAIIDEMEGYCITPNRDISHDEIVYDREYEFPDGYTMIVQVCASSDTAHEPCWTQGVLYDENGTEIGCTDVGETFAGEYCVGDYTVEVKCA